MWESYEGGTWRWMEFYSYSPSETFVVLTADQFVGRDDCLLEQQKQDSHTCRRNGTFPLTKIRVLTTKATKSKKLRIRNRILDMWWMWRLILTVSLNAFHSTNLYCCFSRYKAPANSVVSPSVYKPHITHNSSTRSDEGLTLETSAFESLYGG